MSSSLPRKSYARIPVNIKLPNLIEIQLDSFERLKRDGLGDLFHEVSPIESYNKGMKLYFPSRGPESKQWGLKYWFDEPKHTIEECASLLIDSFSTLRSFSSESLGFMDFFRFVSSAKELFWLFRSPIF